MGLLCFALSGCLVIPYSSEHIELDSGTNPFSSIELGIGEWSGHDIVEMYLDIYDSNRDLRSLSIKNLELVDTKGRTFRLADRLELNTSSNPDPLHRAWFKIYPKSPELRLDVPFKLSFTASLGRENLVVNGTCHEAKELHVTNAWEIGR